MLLLRFVVLPLQGPHVSSVPVSSSRPHPCLSPPEYRIKQPGEPFILNRTQPHATVQALQPTVHELQSLTQQSESQYPVEVVELRHERGTMVKRSPGKLDHQRRRLSETKAEQEGSWGST